MSYPAALSSTDDARLARARVLARALDSAVGVPGTRFRVGLDPLLGLVPGLGDLAGAALSGYIVLVGIQLGASRSLVLRMVANVAIDTLVGSVPVLGDLFDAGWKSNNRNVALIERHVAAPQSTRRASRMLFVGVLLLLVLLAGAGLALTILGIRWLLHH
ncbi:MAG: DUF4112 domain-containing protein [bacterium]